MGVLAVALACGCGGEASLPPGFSEADATAFHRAHEAQLRAEAGPLSAIAAHYVTPGETLVLGVDAGRITTTPSQGPRVRIEVTDDGARCAEGCGTTPVALTAPRQVSLDRFTLAMSPQSGTLRVVVHDPQAPGMVGPSPVQWFPVDAASIVPARWEPDPQQPRISLSTSRGLSKPFVRAGRLTATVQGQAIELLGYRAGVGDTVLVPFTDRTSGVRTYPVGRYLEVTVPDDGRVVLDFNRATNPWCAYSEHYNCPVPPADNRIEVAIEAGERYEPGAPGH